MERERVTQRDRRGEREREAVTKRETIKEREREIKRSVPPRMRF